MPNIVDIIEEFLKVRLNQSNSGIILFRRSELAEKFKCVPSQINYVLSTRFSTDRGYIVETRRGGGGFVRIIRVSLDDAGDLLEIIYDKVKDGISLHDSINIIRYLYEEELITRREAHLMETVVEVTAPNKGPEMNQIRASVLKSMLMVLLRHEK